MSGYYYGSNGFGSFFRSMPAATKNILIVNIIMFAGTLVNPTFMDQTFAMYFPSSPHFRIWQIFTYMFMHGGWWHIIFNMYSLIMFGSIIERMIGTRKFLIFYFLCGLGAVALNTCVEALRIHLYIASGAYGAAAMLKSIPMLGASGAIYGLLIAYAMMFPQNKLTLIFPPVTLSAKWWVSIFIVIELVTGITETAEGVAHFAHLGGALVGFLLIWWWRRKGNLFDRD